MNIRNSAIILLLAVALASSAISVLFREGPLNNPVNVNAQPQGNPEKWEYCTLTDDAKGDYHLSSAKLAFTAQSYGDLAKKIGAPEVQKDAPRLSIFNHLGADGWELCGTHSELAVASHAAGVSNYATANRYIFKRRVK